jgi:hypothetical protein
VLTAEETNSLALNTTHPRELWRPCSPPGTQHYYRASSSVIMAVVFCKAEVYGGGILPQLGCSKFERDDISLYLTKNLYHYFFICQIDICVRQIGTKHILFRIGILGFVNNGVRFHSFVCTAITRRRASSLHYPSLSFYNT